MTDSRYGASFESRIDPLPILEQPAPLRTVGPLRATTPLPQGPIFIGPVSIGADTLCANAALRVTGGGHFTTVLGVGLCPPNTTAGNAWINNQLVVGTDPSGTDTLRVGGSARIKVTGSTTTIIGNAAATIPSVYGLDADTSLVYNAAKHRWFNVSSGAEWMDLTSTALAPFSAGLLTLGTSPLPWGASFFNGQMTLNGSSANLFQLFNLSAANDADTTLALLEGGADGTLGALVSAIITHPSATGANRYVAITSQDTLAFRPIRFEVSAITPYGVGSATLGTAALPWSNTYIGANLVFNSGVPAQLYQLQASSDNLFLLDHTGASVYQFGTVAFVPSVAAGRALGTATLQWSDLFLGTTGTARVVYITSSGSTKRNWMVSAQNNIDQGFEITPSTANGGTTFSTPLFRITAGGTSSGVQINDPGTAFNPTVGGQLTLGDSTHAWANTYISNTSFLYFLDSGGLLGGRISYDGSNNLNINNANNQPIHFFTNGTDRWDIAAAGHLFAFADNTYDIGNSGGPNRPRNVYIAGNLVVGGTITGAVSVLYRNNSLSRTNAADGSLASFSLPGGTLGTNGQAIRISINYANNDAGTSNVNIKFGATTIISVSLSGARAGYINAIVARTGAATQASGAFSLADSLVVGDDFATRTAPAETLSGAITIDFRGSSATGTLSIDYILIELLP